VRCRRTVLSFSLFSPPPIPCPNSPLKSSCRVRGSTVSSLRVRGSPAVKCCFHTFQTSSSPVLPIVRLWIFCSRHITLIIIISKTMFMVLSSWQSYCESSPGSVDECRMAPSGRRPKTKPDDLGYKSACTGCQSLHPPSPFIIITQPES